MTPPETLPVLLLALAIDALFGDPAWLYRRLPHPVAAMGSAIAKLDRLLNRDRQTAGRRRAWGAIAVAALLAGAVSLGWGLAWALGGLAGGWAVEAVVMASLLAQRSLYDHVGRVATALASGDLARAREAVGHIVGRDAKTLDGPGIARAALESLAENFSDGVVAPAFWAALFGLPGILAYKALNTADSMIGYQTDRHRAFGWATARLDDAANLIPARLSALLIALAALLRPGVRFGSALAAAGRDAPRHRSATAGYPEAALAGALGLRLAGPRRYAGRVIEDAWMGDGRADATADDIRRALGLYVTAAGLLLGMVALAWLGLA